MTMLARFRSVDRYSKLIQVLFNVFTFVEFDNLQWKVCACSLSHLVENTRWYVINGCGVASW